MLTFRDMTSEGNVVSGDVQMRAFLAWSDHCHLGHSALAAELCEILETRGVKVEGPHPLHRAADRMVQALRKEDMIRRDGKKWVLTGLGEALCADFRRGLPHE